MTLRPNVLGGSRRVLGGSCRVLGGTCKVLVGTCMVLAAAVQGSAQGRISNAKTETRSAAQGLDREVRAVAARGGVLWIGYRMPMVAGPRQMCCL